MPAATPPPLLPLRTVAILALAAIIGLIAGCLTAVTKGTVAGVLAGATAACLAVMALHQVVGE